MRLRKRWLMISLVIILALAGLLGTAGTARATEYDDDGYVGPDEIIDDDLFITGETIVVDGTINGNLFASGGQITINGSVGGDLFVTGAEVEINGPVGGNLAFAGQILSVSGPIGGSLFTLGNSCTLEAPARVTYNVHFLGYGIDLEEDAFVGRDVEATASQVRVAGAIERHLSASVSSLVIDGSVGGDVNADVSGPDSAQFMMPWPSPMTLQPSGIHVGEGAEIGGRLTYISPVEQAATIRAIPGGGIEYVEYKSEGEFQVDIGQTIAQWFVSRLRELITLLVLGALIAWQAPKVLDHCASQVRTRPLPATGWGLVSLIAGFLFTGIMASLILTLGILVSVITLGGLARTIFGIGFSALGLIFALFLLAVVYGSKLVVAYPVGRWILGRLAPNYTGHGWALALGVAVYMSLRLIPVLAWFIAAAATLVGLGAIWLWLREQRQTSRAANAPALPEDPV